MIDSMGAARRFASARLAAFVVCAGGVLLALPTAGFAADWTPSSEAVSGTSSASSVVTGLDNSSNLTAVWAGSAGIETNVRTAATSSWGSASSVKADAGPTAPDFAESLGTQLATWLGSDGNVYAATGSGSLGSALQLTTSGTASSPQAAIVSGKPTVFWIDGNTIESSTWDTLTWSTPTSPVTPGAGTLSHLSVSISNASGAAAWLRDGNVDTAQIAAGIWTVSSNSPAATTATAVAVAANGSGLAAVAWTDTAGMQVAISTSGGAFTPESGATDASATQPAVGISSSAQVFVASVSSGTVQARIRSAGGTWGSETSLGSGTAPSVSADSSGDVVVSWPGSIRVYDASPPTVTVNPPASPAQPGSNNSWSVTTSDVWADSGNTSWSFNDNGSTVSGGTGTTVSHVDNIPGPETATATHSDAAGNVAIDQATITISAVGPQNTALPTITNGSAPADGETLGYGAGSWTGNPTPTVSHQWQRCNPTCQSTGQTGTSYILTAADVGASIRVEETATNDGGTVVRDSVETPDVAPISTAAPTLGLSASPIADGVTLTASAPSSSWDGATGLTFTYDFQRCSSGCVDMQNSASNQYLLHAADVGTHYQVVVVATAGTATATATSSQTAAVAPRSTASPTLSGVTQDGQVLTASSPDASWDGATTLIRTFLFTQCDTNGANCNTTLQNTTSNTYTLVAADMGSRIRVTVSASKGGSASVPSAPSAATAIIAPFSTGAPATPTVQAPDTLVQDGVTLQASNGSWLDSGSLTFSYQWSQCASTCAAIPGATGATYVLKATDVGTHIQVAVTASAGQGVTSVSSGQTVLVQPLNTSAPSIALPTVQGDGQTFTAVEGGWDGASSLTFTYQWKRCTANGSSCSAILLATGSTYTAGAADVGHALRLAVSASKNGSATTTSADSAQTNALAPLSTGAPALSGAPQDTATITADSPASDWDGVSGLTQTYKFSRCDSGGVNCNTVVQTGSSNTYVLKLADIGSTIRVIASASISTSATVSSLASPATSIITPLLLANGAPAAPTGAAQDGKLLTAGDNGNWADEGGLGFKYQWFQCTSSSSSSCTTSLGAASASNTYTLKPTDVGTRIVVVVTAFVGAGAASSMSAQSLAVAPLNTGASVISTPSPQQDGQVFSASIGGWDGAGGLTIVYQWKRCDSGGNNCTAIGGATSQTYTAAAGDVGQTLKATTTASKGGSATTGSADSAATAVVAPRNSVVPPISGNATDGQVLSTPASTNSAWDNTPATLAFTYQWVRCDATGATCAAISGQTNPTYTLTPDDVADAGNPAARHEIRVQVTATVNTAASTAQSAATGQIAAQTTSNTTLPQVVGDQIANQQLTASAGVWTGTGVQDVSYQWVRCDPPFSSCTNVGTSSLTARYTIQAADVGHYISVIETVQNRLGTQSSQRAPFSKIVLSNQLGATDSPVVSGDFVDGGELSTTDGAWLPSDHLVFSYHWMRCTPNSDGSPPPDTDACLFIPGATSASYQVSPDDVGNYVASQVRADYVLNGSSVTNAVAPSDLEGAVPVAAAPPVNAAKPGVAGAVKEAGALTASPGTWNGTNTQAYPITFAYQWLRCDTSGGACQPIPGATQSAYTPSAQDTGSRLIVRVTASNAGGSAQASSDPTVVVVGTTPTGGSNSGGSDSTPGGGSGGGGAHPAIAGGDKTAPTLKFTIIGGGTLVGGTTLQVDATCPKTEKSCKAKVQLLATLKKPTGKAVAKPVTVASASVIFKSGQKKLLKLKLSSAARTVLRKSLKLKVTLIASVTDAAGNVTPRQTKGLTLRWKKG